MKNELLCARACVCVCVCVCINLKSFHIQLNSSGGREYILCSECKLKWNLMKWNQNRQPLQLSFAFRIVLAGNQEIMGSV